MPRERPTPAAGRRPEKAAGRPPVPHTMIRAGVILTPEKAIPNGSILIHGKRILAVGPRKDVEAAARDRHNKGRSFILEVLDVPDLIGIPGLIDIHQHGGGGADYMDGTVEAVQTALRIHVREGTTSVLPTLMTATREAILKAMAAVDEVRPARRRGSLPGGAERLPDILGLHLEGPFISAGNRGAQPGEQARPFDPEEMRAFLHGSRTPIRIVTLAPELPGALEGIRFLNRRGIIAAAGHSGASFEEAIRAFDAGLRHGTHLFNAMSGFGHREPGLAGALLLNDEASVEVIADGLHLHPATVFLVLQAKPSDKVVLVTDATRPAGSGEPPLRTGDGKLYGSAMTLIQALRNVVLWSGWPLADVLPLVTSNPARLLGLDRKKGRLVPGADADLVLIDRKLAVRAVYAAGRLVPGR